METISWKQYAVTYEVSLFSLISEFIFNANFSSIHARELSIIFFIF